MSEYKIRYEDIIGTYEQKRAVVAQFNLMDDIFFSVVMEHKDAVEYLLSNLPGKISRSLNVKRNILSVIRKRTRSYLTR